MGKAEVIYRCSRLHLRLLFNNGLGAKAMGLWELIGCPAAIQGDFPEPHENSKDALRDRIAIRGPGAASELLKVFCQCGEARA